MVLFGDIGWGGCCIMRLAKEYIFEHGWSMQAAQAGDRSLVPLRLSIYREIHRNWPLSATNCGTTLGKEEWGLALYVLCAAIDQIQRLSGN